MTNRADDTVAPVTDEWLASQCLPALFSESQFDAAALKIDDPTERVGSRVAISILRKSTDELYREHEREDNEVFANSLKLVDYRLSSLAAEIQILEAAREHLLVLSAKSALAPEKYPH